MTKNKNISNLYELPPLATGEQNTNYLSGVDGVIDIQ